MKKTKKLILMAFLLLIFVGTYFISEIYSKYKSSATGLARARVAKWAFKVGDDNISTSNTFSFNLFDSIKEDDTTTIEDEVSSSNNDKVIAPGTGGSFDIVLLNSSEVAAKYGITYTITNNNYIPIKFCTANCTNDSNWTSYLNDIVVDEETTRLDANGGTTTINIQWKWLYENEIDSSLESNDIIDTELGSNTMATVTVLANVTATQIN